MSELRMSEPGFTGLLDLQDFDSQSSKSLNPENPGSDVLKIPVQTSSVKSRFNDSGRPSLRIWGISSTPTPSA